MNAPALNDSCAEFEIVGLRRYPVKAMAGETITHASIDDRGIVGDRWFAVEDDEGHFAAGKNTRRFRRHDAVFEYNARTSGDDVVVERRGARWLVGQPELDAELSRHLGAPMRVTPEGAVAHQDAGAVSIVGTQTLQWCEQQWAVVADPRRLRVNVLVRTAVPFIEEEWAGCRIEAGSAALVVTGAAERCRVIDVAQDGVTPAGRWLKPLASERQMKLAVYADVARTGIVRLGDPLTVSAQ